MPASTGGVMARQSLDVADIFRAQGPAWRRARAGQLGLGQLKVMSAIEHCRTATLGGHVARCEDCAHTQIAYNSCRERHCPKCQRVGARGKWPRARCPVYMSSMPAPHRPAPSRAA